MKRMGFGDGEEFDNEFASSPKKAIYPADRMIKVEEGMETPLDVNNIDCNLPDMDTMNHDNDVPNSYNENNVEMIGNNVKTPDNIIDSNSISVDGNMLATSNFNENNVNGSSINSDVSRNMNGNFNHTNDNMVRNNNGFSNNENMRNMSGRSGDVQNSVENQQNSDDLPVADVIRSFKYTAECLNKKRHLSNVEYSRIMQQKQRQNFQGWGGPTDNDSLGSNSQQNGYLRHSPVNQHDLYVTSNPINQRKNSPPIAAMQRNVSNNTSPNQGNLRNNLPPSVFRNNGPSNVFKNSTSPINFRTDSSGNLVRNNSPPNNIGNSINLRMNSVPAMRGNNSQPDIVPGNNMYQQNMNSYHSHQLTEKPEIRKATVKHSEREEIWSLLQTELRKKYHNAILKKIRYTDCDNDEISIYKNSELSDAIFNEGITKFRLFYQIFEVTYVARNSAASAKSKETNDFFGTRKCYPSPNMAWNLFSSSVMDISAGVRMKYVLYTDRAGCSITVATANELDQAIFVEGITRFCICFDVISNVSSSSTNKLTEISLVKY